MQDIISVNLERAVQVCTDIASHIVADSNEEPPNSMGTAFDSLACLEVISQDLADRMKRAVGFRNISMHTYQQVDWAIVFDICTNRLGDFAEFARSVEAKLPEYTRRTIRSSAGMGFHVCKSSTSCQASSSLNPGLSFRVVVKRLVQNLHFRASASPLP